MKDKTYIKINIIYFIAMVLVALIFVLGAFGIITSDWLSTFLIQIVIMFALPILLYSLFTKTKIKDTFKTFGIKKVSPAIIGFSILLGIVLYFINSFVATVSQSFIALLGYETVSTSTTTVQFSYALLLKEFLLSAILPGICEEVLHRGLMLHAGKKQKNPHYCLIISSLLFGLMHLNINQFFYAAILGCLMGYVTLVADSIIPSMIIHFMNNALATYFYYGYYLDWPLASFINGIETALYSNIFLFIIFTTIGVCALIYLYFYFVKKIAVERSRREVQKLVHYLELNQLSITEAQSRVNEINVLLKKNSQNRYINRNKKPTFSENIFLYSSLFLGGIVTISSFIWGII